MYYKEYKPGGTYSKTVIDYFWVLRTENPTEFNPGYLFPDTSIHLVFDNLPGPGINKLYIIGCLTHFMEVVPSSHNHHLLGVKFLPGGFYELFGSNVQAVRNAAIDMDLVDTSIFKKLNSLSSMGTSASIQLIEKYLDQRLRRHTSYETGKLRQAVLRIDQHRGGIGIGKLSLELSVSERKIERIFQTVTSISPKKYCQLTRFNYCRILLTTSAKKQSLLQIAVESGYYDQSHMHNDVVELTNHTPGALRKLLMTDLYKNPTTVE